MSTSTIVTDPYSSMQFVELSGVWTDGPLRILGKPTSISSRGVKHAQHGVLAWHITTVLHTGTHMNAPIHLIQKGADLAAVSPDRLFGNGAVLDVPKKTGKLSRLPILRKRRLRSRKVTLSSSTPVGTTSTLTASNTTARLRACQRTRPSGWSARSRSWSR